MAGTSVPRKNVGVGGEEVRWAQSRGEWPGLRRTFFGGRAGGASVEVLGAREDDEGTREPFGGARNVEAAEGGGQRVVESVGGVALDLVDGSIEKDRVADAFGSIIDRGGGGGGGGGGGISFLSFGDFFPEP